MPKVAHLTLNAYKLPINNCELTWRCRDYGESTIVRFSIECTTVISTAVQHINDYGKECTFVDWILSIRSHSSVVSGEHLSRETRKSQIENVSSSVRYGYGSLCSLCAVLCISGKYASNDFMIMLVKTFKDHIFTRARWSWMEREWDKKTSAWKIERCMKRLITLC